MRLPSGLARATALAVLAAGVVLGGASGRNLIHAGEPAPPRAEAPPAAPRLNDLSTDAREIEDAFNEARGHARLLLVLSPT